MAKFRKSEWARIRKSLSAKEIRVCGGDVGGSDCEIRSVLPGSPPNYPKAPAGQWYEVRTKSGWEGYVDERLLEKRTGSWDEIERATGFRPSKRKAPEREPETVI